MNGNVYTNNFLVWGEGEFVLCVGVEFKHSKKVVLNWYIGDVFSVVVYDNMEQMKKIVMKDSTRYIEYVYQSLKK